MTDPTTKTPETEFIEVGSGEKLMKVDGDRVKVQLHRRFGKWVVHVKWTSSDSIDATLEAAEWHRWCISLAMIQAKAWQEEIDEQRAGR